MLTEKPWLGFFTGYDRRDFCVGVGANGRIELQVKKDGGGVLGVGRVIYIDPQIIELDGTRKVVKALIPESLTSDQKAMEQPTKTTYRGKVTGNAEFEVNLEYDGDDFYVSGRLLDAGELKNPLEFQIRVKYGDVYRYTAPEKLKDETSRDSIETLSVDKKKNKIKVFEKVDLASEEINGKGLTFVEVQLKGLNSRKFLHEAQGACTLRLENNGGLAEAPLQGFSVIWQADAEKNKDGKARLHMEVK